MIFTARETNTRYIEINDTNDTTTHRTLHYFGMRTATLLISLAIAICCTTAMADGRPVEWDGKRNHYAARVIESALEHGMSLVDAATYGELALSEGLRLTPYDDLAGVRTVCFGETQEVEERTYTLDECIIRFLMRVEHDFHDPVSRCTHSWDMLPVLVQESIVEFAYNVGVQRYCNSSVRKWLDEGRGAEACARFLLWNKIRRAGRLIESKGLTNRRAREAALCRAGFR